MTVWYSSFDNDMMSDRAHEEHFNALMESYDSNDDFEAFLGETYSLIELFNLTEYERGKAREAFEDWKREKALDDDVYVPYDVRLANDEVEK